MKNRGTRRDPDRAQETLPNGSDEPATPRQLASSARKRLRRLKHDLVLQLYLRLDPLWEAIHDVRDRWDITVKVRLPPALVGRLLPEKAPNH